MKLFLYILGGLLLLGALAVWLFKAMGRELSGGKGG